MISVGHQVVIRAPANQIFDFVVNAENDRAWVGFALSARRLTPGPIGRGTRFQQTGTVLGVRIPLVWEIKEFEPARRMRGETLSGPARFWGEYTLEPVPQGSQFRKAGRIEFEGVLKLAEAPLAGIFQYALIQDMERLKRLLEKRGSA